MINLTYDDKQMLGFEYVQELLSPSSCFGVEKSRRLMPYTREQKQELLSELDNIERLCAHFDECKKTLVSLTEFLIILRISDRHFQEVMTIALMR